MSNSKSSEEDCRLAIENFIRNGSNISINDKDVFNYENGCQNMKQFQKVFDKHYSHKYSYSKDESQFGSMVCMFVGGILMATGAVIMEAGNSVAEGVTIKKKSHF